MKKLSLLALAFVLGTAVLFSANTNSDNIKLNAVYHLNHFINDVPDIPATQIRSQILDLLVDADFTVEKDMTVSITFTFNSAGEIVVLDVDTKNSDVLNYIRKNVNKQSISVPGEANRVFTIPVKFSAKTKK